MPRIGPMELVIVLVIILVIFGAGKLPQIGSALGKSIREFRKAASDKDSPEEEQKSVSVDGTSATRQEQVKEELKKS